MSLFIGSLAFDGPEAARAVRVGVLAASLIAAIYGIAVLNWATRRSIDQPAAARPAASGGSNH